MFNEKRIIVPNGMGTIVIVPLSRLFTPSKEASIHAVLAGEMSALKLKFPEGEVDTSRFWVAVYFKGSNQSQRLTIKEFGSCVIRCQRNNFHFAKEADLASIANWEGETVDLIGGDPHCARGLILRGTGKCRSISQINRSSEIPLGGYKLLLIISDRAIKEQQAIEEKVNARKERDARIEKAKEEKRRRRNKEKEKVRLKKKRESNLRMKIQKKKTLLKNWDKKTRTRKWNKLNPDKAMMELLLVIAAQTTP
jgi:hypothetical protein